MRKFKVGQRVRIVRAYQHPQHVGRVVTLTDTADELANAEAYWSSTGNWGTADQFAPITNDYQRFMERVLKPIPEATPDFVGYVERFPATACGR